MTQVSEAQVTYLENQPYRSMFMLRLCNYYKYGTGQRDYDRERREDEESRLFNEKYNKTHDIWLIDNQRITR